MAISLRGALRIICYRHAKREIFPMLYRKSEQKDLSADQRRALAKFIKLTFTPEDVQAIENAFVSPKTNSR